MCLKTSARASISWSLSTGQGVSALPTLHPSRVSRRAFTSEPQGQVPASHEHVSGRFRCSSPFPDPPHTPRSVSDGAQSSPALQGLSKWHQIPPRGAGWRGQSCLSLRGSVSDGREGTDTDAVPPTLVTDTEEASLAVEAGRRGARGPGSHGRTDGDGGWRAGGVPRPVPSRPASWSRSCVRGLGQAQGAHRLKGGSPQGPPGQGQSCVHTWLPGEASSWAGEDLMEKLVPSRIFQRGCE